MYMYLLQVVVDSYTRAEKYEEVVVDPGKAINADMALSIEQNLHQQHYLYVMTDQKVIYFLIQIIELHCY